MVLEAFQPPKRLLVVGPQPYVYPSRLLTPLGRLLISYRDHGRMREPIVTRFLPENVNLPNRLLSPMTNLGSRPVDLQRAPLQPFGLQSGFVES